MQGRRVIQGGIISVLLFPIYLEPLSKMIDAAITGVNLAGMATVWQFFWINFKWYLKRPFEINGVGEWDAIFQSDEDENG